MVVGYLNQRDTRYTETMDVKHKGICQVSDLIQFDNEFYNVLYPHWASIDNEFYFSCSEDYICAFRIPICGYMW